MPVSMFAVFDGHAGKEVAAFCAQHMVRGGQVRLAVLKIPEGLRARWGRQGGGDCAGGGGCGVDGV